MTAAVAAVQVAGDSIVCHVSGTFTTRQALAVAESIRQHAFDALDAIDNRERRRAGAAPLPMPETSEVMRRVCAPVVSTQESVLGAAWLRSLSPQALACWTDKACSEIPMEIYRCAQARKFVLGCAFGCPST